MATFASATSREAVRRLAEDGNGNNDDECGNSSGGVAASGSVWVNKGHTGKNPNDDFDAVLKKYGLEDPWDVVDLFEKRMAEYAGSKYAVSVDNCTDAMFLCLKYDGCEGSTVKIPSRTYCSVPCTIIHAGCNVEFVDDWEWSGLYQLKPTRIVDGACRFRRGMYTPGTLHCISFHIRKHLPIGKGGMIFTDEKDAYDWFRIARYEGRHTDVLYKDDEFDMVGWNMYMPPEDAARGLALLENMGDEYPDMHNEKDYRPLSDFSCYKNHQAAVNHTANDSSQPSRPATIDEVRAMEARVQSSMQRLEEKLDMIMKQLV